MYEVVDFIAQNPVGPRGADFGKGSPIGLFMLVLLLFVVLLVGWDLSRRLKRQRIRRVYAETHGIDPFDIQKIDESIQADVANRRAGGTAAAAPSAAISVEETEAPEQPVTDRDEPDADPGR
ncbi:hypothetical protein [Corynebacterium sputi]|uniref:hypothetical protein n=1 Tax=Corynebacterium sputi TaxID=489915 RepID=UPI0003FBF3ED|nr:hypothetical protein [Corynebacterium sputi]